MSALLVRDVMVRDVAYVSIPGFRTEVLKVLQNRKVSGVPVVKDGRVVGLVTRSDLLRNPEEDQIAMLMTRNPYTVSPGTLLSEASRIMVERKIRRLPVVEDGTLVGLVTVADIVRAIADLGIDDNVDAYMERRVVVAWSEMPLPVIGAIMEYADVHACPVIDSKLVLVGIVSDRDLISKSIVEESVEKAGENTSSDMDDWTWESLRDSTARYYAVHRITLKDIPVREAMVPPITAIKSSRISECAAIMRRDNIDQIPVVNAHQKLIGMLNDQDLLKAFMLREDKGKPRGS